MPVCRKQAARTRIATIICDVWQFQGRCYASCIPMAHPAGLYTSRKSAPDGIAACRNWLLTVQISYWPGRKKLGSWRPHDIHLPGLVKKSLTKFDVEGTLDFR